MDPKGRSLVTTTSDFRLHIQIDKSVLGFPRFLYQRKLEVTPFTFSTKQFSDSTLVSDPKISTLKDVETPWNVPVNEKTLTSL